MSSPCKMATHSSSLTKYHDHHPKAYFLRSDALSQRAIVASKSEDITPVDGFRSKAPGPLQRRRQPHRRCLKKESPKRKHLNKENVVLLPSGFKQRDLHKAAISKTPSACESSAVSHRDGVRRCETKVMLQTADEQLFNPYFEPEDIQQFAHRFKALRTQYGFSQADVGASLCQRYGSTYCQATVSRFESLVLSHSNMCQLRPPFEQWIDEIERGMDVPAKQLRRAKKREKKLLQPSQSQMNHQSTFSNLVIPIRKRKNRTKLDESQLLALVLYFDGNQRPNSAQMDAIARTFHVHFEIVRNWFSNRRQKTLKGVASAVKVEEEGTGDEDIIVDD